MPSTTNMDATVIPATSKKPNTNPRPDVTIPGLLTAAHALTDYGANLPGRHTTCGPSAPSALAPQRRERAITIRDNRLGEVDRWPVRCR